jgi:threonine/homoserine/homoserine lactone efflux protein
MPLLTFLVAGYSLLALPGPTNTLLATSGAGVGFSRSLPLLAAELCGYLAAIALLRLFLGPFVVDSPIAGVILRTVVTAYILYLAALLWRSGSRELRNGRAVTFGQVLLTTLLNPKATIFAFLLLPLQAGPLELAPWLALISFQIVTAGATWLAVGAVLGRGVRRSAQPHLVNRVGAFALVTVSGLVWLQSLGSALL